MKSKSSTAVWKQRPASHSRAVQLSRVYTWHAHEPICENAGFAASAAGGAPIRGLFSSDAAALGLGSDTVEQSGFQELMALDHGETQ